MADVGLITYCDDNMGACLQAYALQTSIVQQGHHCHIIPYARKKEFKDSLSKWKHRLNLSLFHLPSYIKFRKINHRHANDFARRAQRFGKFRDKWLRFGDQAYDSFAGIAENTPAYDSYVCGSDQIWNPLLHHNDRVYFLDFVPDGKKRIAYAPSIGVSQIPEKYRAGMAELLGKMTYLSVREQQGASIIRELTGRLASHVLDPTLLLNANDWETVMEPVAVPSPYILLYLFGDLPYIGRIVEQLKAQTGLPVVSLPFNPREMEDKDSIKVFDAGPDGFAWLIKNAALVCTDSFHATVFSINLNTPFYSLLRQVPSSKSSMLSRLTSVLGQFSLQDRLIQPEDRIPSGGHFDIDFERGNKILEELRSDSLNYLGRSLAGESV